MFESLRPDQYYQGLTVFTVSPFFVVSVMIAQSAFSLKDQNHSVRDTLQPSSSNVIGSPIAVINRNQSLH